MKQVVRRSNNRINHFPGYARLLAVCILLLSSYMTYAQTGFTATAPTGGLASIGGTSLGSGNATITVTKPTSGCYGYGFNFTDANNGFTFTSAAFALPHATANRWKYSSGAGTATITLVPNTATTQTMAACSPRSAITLTPVLTLTTSVGVWSENGTYVFVPVKSNLVVTVALTTGGTAINSVANNLCTSSWHTYSNLNWGWVTFANPTATPSNTGPYCNGNISLTSSPSTTNTGTQASTYTYSWSGTGTFSSTTAANPTVTSGATGNYTVTVTDAYGCVSTPTPTAVTVKPTLDPSSAAATIANCQLNSSAPYADLTASSPAGGTSGVWAVTASPGTITSPSSNNTQITGLSNSGATSTVSWTLSYTALPACSVPKSINITPLNLASTLNSVSLQNAGAAGSSPRPGYYGCETCVVRDGNTYVFYDNVGKIVAKIQDVTPPTAELASTEVCMGFDYNAGTSGVTVSDVKTVTTNFGDQQPYLPRSWTIKPAANTDVQVTLYYTAAELNALQSKASGTAYAFPNFYDLSMTKYASGGTGTFTAPASAGGVNVPIVITKYPNLATGPDYQVTFDANSFSTFYLHPVRFPFAPLPVELTSFTGINTGDRNRLDWVTASETDSKKFILEKNTGGSSWIYVSELPAAGNSNTPKNYQLFDLSPAVGDNYYRLKMIDIDGSFTYSNEINVVLRDAVINNIDNIYPNPANSHINVQIQSTATYNTRLIVYDVVGKEVYKMPIDLVKGYNMSQVDISLLNRGAYIVQFTDADNKIHTAKFIKQ